MILHCNFEELRALSSAVEMMVAEAESPETAVAAPPEGVAMAEQLVPLLTGDLTIDTLEDQRRIRGTVALIVTDLLRRMDEKVIEFSPGHEECVALYFDYAHSRTVLNRLDLMGAEMAAIIDLIAGGNPGAAAGITFPD
ncbi:MAG TPA: hypothetical protein VE913_00310 [Longimicrobium sp.]|nr:hypothetical protein [Longimicrobium sp.]